MSKRTCLICAALIAAFAAAPMSAASAATIFKIDVDRQGSATEAGFTSLNVPGQISEASVTVDGVTFTRYLVDEHLTGGDPINSGDNVTNQNGSALLQDSLTNGATGEKIGLTIDGLPDGLWEAKVWSWDSRTAPYATVTGQSVGVLDSTGADVLVSEYDESDVSPATFQFNTADYEDTFTVFIEATNGQARFNGLELTLVPEPASLALLGVGGLALIRRRNG